MEILMASLFFKVIFTPTHVAFRSYKWPYSHDITKDRSKFATDVTSTLRVDSCCKRARLDFQPL